MPEQVVNNLSSLGLIDTHCHLHGSEFDIDRESVLERALAAGVSRIITVGVGAGMEEAKSALRLAKQYDFVWATVGVHPHDAAAGVEKEELKELALDPRCLAVGETGLDFYRQLSPHSAQEAVFRQQIELALEVKKPLIVHCREAGQSCLEILQQYDLSPIGGVFHCYAEDQLFAQKLWQLGFYVSIPGTVTFKKAQRLREIAAQIPLKQLLLETDAPYLAPEPHRGKRCESSFLVETAKVIAALHNISLEQLATITSKNAQALFWPEQLLAGRSS